MKLHDILIIGAGLAGMRAAIAAPPDLDVAVISKVQPVRSHSVAAQGGINAALGRMIPGKPMRSTPRRAGSISAIRTPSRRCVAKRLATF
jgi:succinate dehydrogenase/fumarate reductase flavoprotein subunit